MILTAFHGFCMALADSVPSVSGRTLASHSSPRRRLTALKGSAALLFALLDMAVVVGLTLLRGSSAGRRPARVALPPSLLISSSPAGRHHGDGAAGHLGLVHSAHRGRITRHSTLITAAHGAFRAAGALRAGLLLLGSLAVPACWWAAYA